MRSTSFSPYQAPATDASASLRTALPQDSVQPTTSPESLFALSGSAPSYKQSMSTEQLLSVRLSPNDKSRAGMTGSPEHVAPTWEGQHAERIKRRLPQNHARRFAPSTEAPAPADSVVIRPVNQWSEIAIAANGPQLNAKVLLTRMRGADRNDAAGGNVLTTQASRGRLDVTDIMNLPITASSGPSTALSRTITENVSPDFFVSAIPPMPRESDLSDRNVPFSPDLIDIYLGKDVSKACDSNPSWDWQSFARCRATVSGPLSMRGQAAMLNPAPEGSMHGPQIGMPSVLLPASSPLWFLLTGSPPRWFFPVGVNDHVAHTVDADAPYASTTPATASTGTLEQRFGPQRQPPSKYKT